MNRLKAILPIIVIAQFCCTSLWFASNAVMSDLVINFALAETAIGHLTSAVQFGFILGTLVFALLAIADRFSPSKVFLISALLGAAFNAGILWEANTLATMLSLRFLTGFFLAGIYPVGMKIAADYFEKGLGKSLGFLVGALVLGTAFPHLLKGITNVFPWESVIITTSSLAVIGGLMMVILVPDGPYRKQSQGVNVSAFFGIFKNQNLRAAAFGYFGHMWELYAFWTFTPLMLKTYNDLHPETNFNIPILSFLIIGIGGLACVLSGYLSEAFGTKKIALISLVLSCACCLISPFLFAIASQKLFIAFMLFWGMTVVADSPLFSTLVAQNAAAEIKGTALTIVNSIGFAITIISIQLISSLKTITDSNSIYICLAIGPVLGLLALSKKTK
ncbi:MFS transporter [Flavobacterium degerlachei]|jgi:MFS family permease|uniref:Predicted arabinose efflux permease, MFS family n=1 Tax=Flavobacterium degerlachei TaxID=229203 RepID=A0A1H3BA23_9FLAO|nr:MFS transporter [Flavobacterium degerlachei]SDX38481.1 Predicted arabinose efflux permease, MFS family [Flavobacterium degerlachei]